MRPGARTPLFTCSTKSPSRGLGILGEQLGLHLPPRFVDLRGRRADAVPILEDSDHVHPHWQDGFLHGAHKLCWVVRQVLPLSVRLRHPSRNW